MIWREINQITRLTLKEISLLFPFNLNELRHLMSANYTINYSSLHVCTKNEVTHIFITFYLLVPA